jgi:hypothetical protein
LVTAERILGYQHEIFGKITRRFSYFICVPIECGGLFAIVGNGRAHIWARSILRDGKSIPKDWFKEVDAEYLARVESMECVYFGCLTCERVI